MLFDQITSFDALERATYRAISGKRRKNTAAAFMARLEIELPRLEQQLKSRQWRPSGYKVVRITDPKPRTISIAPFRDRVVHQALCHVIEPLFDRGFIHDSYACRKGKGSHRAARRYEFYRDRYRYVLRGDIYRYFPSIDHAILKRLIRRRIRCQNTLWLIDSILDASNAQEPMNRYFPGDDLFEPSNRRRGLPIGNLTSQLSGNIYLDGFDHYVKEVLRLPYIRYMDDFVLFHDDRDQLQWTRQKLQNYLDGRRLLLHPRKTWIQSANQSITFLGFVLLPNGARRLPADNVNRFNQRLRSLRDRWQAGTIEYDEVFRRVDAWIAHAKHADTLALRKSLFKGGWFDPVQID